MSHVYSPSFHWAEDRQPSQFLDSNNHSYWTSEYSKFRAAGNDQFAPFISENAAQNRRTAEQILKASKPSNIGYSTRDGAVKTNMIIGRRNEARSQ